MAKKITGYIKLQVQAGAANPSPPIGPALGQRGLNIMEFCKAFNAKTQDQKGYIIPVVITVYADRSFTFFDFKISVKEFHFQLRHFLRKVLIKIFCLVLLIGEDDSAALGLFLEEHANDGRFFFRLNFYVIGFKFRLRSVGSI